MGFLQRILGIGQGSREEAPSAAPKMKGIASQPSLAVGWTTDAGKVRSQNEDTAFVITAAHSSDESIPAFGLGVLADGMGGHQSGEVASSVAVRRVADYVIRQFYVPSLTSQERGTSQPSLNDLLVDAVREANQAVLRDAPGGGTTLTCALLLGRRVYIAHVGDSRAYLVDQDGMEQITRDHSLADRLIEMGQLSLEEAVDHPQRNVLYRAVGQDSALDVDIHVRTMPCGTRLLLCSDGLWSEVTEDMIQKMVMDTPSLQSACDRLVEAANTAGGHDNATAILMQVALGCGEE